MPLKWQKIASCSARRWTASVWKTPRPRSLQRQSWLRANTTSRPVSSKRWQRLITLACLQSSAPPLPLAAPAAVWPITATTTRRSAARGLKPRQWRRFWSMNRCLAGKNSRWRWCATLPITPSSSARLKTSTRWACIPAIRSPSPLP